jgi:hypothetical protein
MLAEPVAVGSLSETSGFTSIGLSSSLKSRRWRFVTAHTRRGGADFVTNRSLVKVLDLRAEAIAKAAQSCLVRSRHCGQHFGRGRCERLNKDELRLIAYGHVEQQRR